MIRIPSRLFATTNMKRTADKLKPNEPLSPVCMMRILYSLFATANGKRTDDRLKLQAPTFSHQHDTTFPLTCLQ